MKVIHAGTIPNCPHLDRVRTLVRIGEQLRSNKQGADFVFFFLR